VTLTLYLNDCEFYYRNYNIFIKIAIFTVNLYGSSLSFIDCFCYLFFGRAK
jgi:hypothetical protein